MCTGGGEAYLEAEKAVRSPWRRPTVATLRTGDADPRAVGSQRWDHGQARVPGRNEQGGRRGERGVPPVQVRGEVPQGSSVRDLLEVKLIRLGFGRQGRVQDDAVSQCWGH